MVEDHSEGQRRERRAPVDAGLGDAGGGRRGLRVEADYREVEQARPAPPAGAGEAGAHHERGRRAERERAQPAAADRHHRADRAQGRETRAVRHLADGQTRQEGEHVLLTVADRGPGIAEAERARAIERFVRLPQNMVEPGSGLGLSLAAAVAVLHGGELKLEDNAPGLKVVIALPRNSDA